ncbi:MAG: response regulator [Bacteroidota bacterium]|nr:response regulator [Bacteroidota bacterium]
MKNFSSQFTSNNIVKSFINQRLIIAFVVALLTLTGVGLLGFRTVLELSGNYDKIIHTYTVINKLDNIFSEISFAQTELRTFYITDDSSYLLRYRTIEDSIRNKVAIVDGLISDNSRHKISLRTLNELIITREQFNNDKIKRYVLNGFVSSEKYFSTKESQNFVRRIDSVIIAMESAEKQELSQQVLNTSDKTNRTLLLITIGGFVGFVILLTVFILLTLENQRRTKAELEIRNSEQRFVNFLEAVPAGIYILSADGKPYYANEEAKNILGSGIVPHASSEKLAEIYNAYIQGTDTHYPAEMIPIVRALKGERSTISDIEIWKPDAVIPLFVTGAPIYDSEGNLQYAMAAFIDISEQKQTQQQLSESEERFRQIIENASDLIYRADKRGKFTYVNPTGLSMFGYTIEDVIGMHFTMFVKETEQQKVARVYYRQMLSKTKSSYREFTATKKNGKEIILGQSVELLFENNKVVGFLAIARDISEKNRYEQELKEAKETAESATVAKSQFLATMSHEIRTPMNGVIGMTDLLLQTSLNDEQREYTEIIRSSGETLLTLINDILDFSKIESGKLEMEKRPIEVQSLIEETFDLIARSAVEKQLDIVYLIDPSVPPFIIGDPVRLRQILLNLTNNAIKFTNHGEVLVSVEAIGNDGTQTTLQFSVKDTGIGIPKDKASKLFQAFSQVDASTTRKFGGTGLGLVITKRLVELMDGEVWIESEEGKGSTFYFTIKVPTTTTVEGLPKKYIRGKIPELLGKRILLVDDNATNLNILSIQCTNWGMYPRSTASQSEALKWVNNNDPFDMAIIDFNMPEINGIELARMIHTSRNDKPFPIVLFSSSGHTDFTNEEQTLFAAVILKPIKQAQLYSTITDVLAKNINDQLLRVNIEPQKTEPLANNVPLTILIAEDNFINQKLALRLLQQLGYLADLAANGKEALEMVKQKRYDIILMDLHMPELDGLSATREIVRTVDASVRPKIIAMTADAMSGDREKCINAGMDDYISKPVRLEGLRSMLEIYGGMIVERKKYGQSQYNDNDAMFVRLQEILSETDKNFFREFVQPFPAQTAEMMEQLRTAWNKRDTEQLIFVSHKLRGLALSYGANALAEYCKVIENNIETNPNSITDESIVMVEQSMKQSYETLLLTVKKLGIV